MSVGISNYSPLSGFGDLNYAEKDASKIAEVLKDFSYDMINIDQYSATERQIYNLIHEISTLNEVKDSTFVFFFSGHGFSDGKESFLVTYETRLGDPSSGKISVSNLLEKIASYGYRNVVILIDACRNELPKGSKSSSSIMQPFSNVKPKGLNVIYSSEEGKYSYEDDDLKSGVFTHFIVDFMKTNPNKSYQISFDDLEEYLTKKIPKFTHAKHYRPIQVPQVYKDGIGDMVFYSYSYLEPNLISLSDVVISVNEVSNAEYELCVLDGFCNKPKWKIDGSISSYRNLMPDLSKSNFPVVGITWVDASKYAEWLSNESGRNYRLPSLEDWKNVKSKVPFLDINCLDCDDDIEFLAPVNLKSDSIKNIFGNVWEFTSTNSKLEEGYSGRALKYAVVGGAWSTSKSAIYDYFVEDWKTVWVSPQYAGGDIGFRLASDHATTDIKRELPEGVSFFAFFQSVVMFFILFLVFLILVFWVIRKVR